MSTIEWSIPNLDGVHIVVRQGDTHALQFPEELEDFVLEQLEDWVAALRSGEPTDAETVLDTAITPAAPTGPRSSKAPRAVPRHPNPHSPMRTHPGAAGQFASDERPVATTARKSRAEALALAMGGSGAPAAAATVRQPTLRRPATPPNVKSTARGTVISNQPKGVALTKEQIDAWNAQQSEGMAIFSELKRTRKPHEKPVNVDEVNVILRNRIESRGDRFMRTPDDVGEAPEASTADDIPVVEGELVTEVTKVAETVTTIAQPIHPPAPSTPTVQPKPPQRAPTPAVSAALETLPNIPQATEGPLTPDRTPLNTPERRWATQEAERQAIAREMKAFYGPKVAVTMLMVVAEQENRARARGEELIVVVAPGAKGGLVEALGVGPESPVAPAAATAQAAPPAAVQPPQERVVLGDVMHVPAGMEEQARGPAYPVPSKPALVPIAPVQSGPMAPAAVQNGEGAKPS